MAKNVKVRRSVLFRQKQLWAVVVAIFAAALFDVAFSAKGQDKAIPSAQDVILARKALMNAIEENTDRIGRMISDHDVNVAEARARANTIYVLLAVFPHLFPPDSNQWKEGVDLDPVTDTVAAPEIWTNFDEFYRLAAAAAQRADEMRRAASEEEVKSLHRSLGNVCDFCHALYYKE